MFAEKSVAIARIVEYLDPSKEIKESISALELFFQLVNQDVMSAYYEYSKTNSFKGSLSDYVGLRAMEEYFGDFNKRWSYLKRAIYLVSSCLNKVPSEIFSALKGDELQKIVKMIQDGIKARVKVAEWLVPLSSCEDSFEAINDALQVDLLRQFQVLELYNLEEHVTEKVSLYPSILQIDSPAGLARYLRHNTTIRDCIIVTVRRNPVHDWKSFFYIFLVYNGKLYSVDNSDRRLNENNCEGTRNPDRYLERVYQHVWLPVELIFKSSGNPATKELMLKNSSVYKIGSYEDYVDTKPGYIYWITMFLYRVIDYVSTNEVPKGVTNADLPKLLGNGTSIEYKHDAGCLDNGSGSYLMNIYGSKLNALVPKKNAFSIVVATPEHMEKLVAYKYRQSQAEQVQSLVVEDFNNNCARVYDHIRKLVRQQPIGKFIEKAFKDLSYTYTYYAQFGVDRGIGEHKGAIEGISEVRKGKIFSKSDWFGPDRGRTVVLNTEHDTNKGWKCLLSPNYSTRRFRLHFSDYYQFLEFYELHEKDVPPEMIQHLHQQSELYTGNSILDDTDPLDSVVDPWFVFDEPIEYVYSRRYEIMLDVCFAICARCVKSICHRLGVDAEHWLK